MSFEEIVQEIVRKIKEKNLSFFNVRRTHWPQGMRMEISRASVKVPSIVYVDETSTMRSFLAYLSMNLWHGDKMVIAWWCPDVEDVIATDWNFTSEPESLDAADSTNDESNS